MKTEGRTLRKISARTLYFLWLGLTSLGWVVTGPAAADQNSQIRLGWQIPWATQGQLVMGLKYTNITNLVGLSVDYIGFAYGGPLNRAALAGEVDVLLTADQPALVLLSRDPSYRIVSRMMYNRVCIYVPADSKVRELSHLSGKIVMGPTGAAAERVAMAAMSRAGVDLSTIQPGKLDMAQQSALLANAKDPARWPGVDALYGFDPLPAVFKEQGKARILQCGKVVSVVVATSEMLQERRDQLKAFLTGFMLSWNNFTRNPERMNALFSAESRLNVSDAVLDDAASIEPNRWVNSIGELRFGFTRDDFIVFNEANRFLLDRGIIKDSIDARDYIDMTFINELVSDTNLTELAGKVTITK